ncbi:MAG: cyclic nucleotide-binding/CBS domain-containing protein [Nitrososphaerales archaeon]
MSLATVSVSEVMTKDVKSAKTSKPVLHAIGLMAKHKISSVIIVDKNKKPVGIFTEKDAIRVIAERDRPLVLRLKTVMSSPIISINTFTSIKMAMTIMAMKDVNHLPVVENEKLVGIVSEKDFFRYIVGHEVLIEELLSEGVAAQSKDLLEKLCAGMVKSSVWPSPVRA